MTTMAQFYSAVRAFILRPWVMLALIVINVVAGVLGGIYWYGPELLRTPWWAMVFVPDCPLFSFLFAVALAGIGWNRGRDGKEWTLFNALTAVGLVKYGLWTITVWVLFWSAGYSATVESVLMTTAHVGMVLEGVLLFSFVTRLRWHHVLIAGAWFFLSDWVDYGLGFRPRMAPGVSETTMMWEMILASAILTMFLGWLVWQRQQQPNADQYRSVAT